MENNGIRSNLIFTRYIIIFAIGLGISFPRAGSLFAESSPQTLSPAKQSETENRVAMDGYLSSRYVSRSTTTHDAAMLTETRVSDEDLFGELRFDISMPKTKLFEFHFLGTLRQDLDGNSDLTGHYPLEDIGNTYRTESHGYLYDAHLGINDPLPHLTQIRIGRQAGLRDEPVFFDGLATDLHMGSLVNLTLYGGAAVRFYETDTHWGNDTLGGAGLDITPAAFTKFSLDYVTIISELSTTIDHQDSMVSLKLWQSISSFMKASVKYRYLNSDPRDVTVRLISSIAPADLEINLNYFKQFKIETVTTNELSLYSSVLGVSSPYQSYDVKLRKQMGPHLAVDLGYFKRALQEETQASAFDRDFSRAFLLLEIMDLPADRVSFTLTSEEWSTKGRKFNSSGLDIGYRFKNRKNASVNAGAYYSLYKYEYYNELGLRENILTYYMNGKVPLGSGVSLNGSYEYEDSLEKYQMFKLGMRYDF